MAIINKIYYFKIMPQKKDNATKKACEALAKACDKKVLKLLNDPKAETSCKKAKADCHAVNKRK
jgi:hypothetical protein